MLYNIQIILYIEKSRHDPYQARETLKNIQGVLVEMPLLFLEKEDLDSFTPDALVQYCDK